MINSPTHVCIKAEDGLVYYVPVRNSHREQNPARDKWLLAAIAKGLQHLVVLNLPNHPPAETIAITAKAWLMVLLNQNIDWNAEQDNSRIETAFLKLMEHPKWPAPIDFLNVLPPRTPPLALSAPRETPERREQRRQGNLVGIRAVLDTMKILPKKEQ